MYQVSFCERKSKKCSKIVFRGCTLVTFSAYDIVKLLRVGAGGNCFDLLSTKLGKKSSRCVDKFV